MAVPVFLAKLVNNNPLLLVLFVFSLKNSKLKVGNGQWLRREQKMPILPPPPARSVFPTEVSRY